MSALRPVVSEKAFAGAEKGVYTFKVQPSDTKLTIKRDVESQFKVTVVKVAIAKSPAKTRRRGRFTGLKSGYKKAVVYLKKGDKITELEG